MTPAYLDARQAAGFLGIGLRTLHKLRHEPKFPQPREFGPRVTRWKATELEAWADASARDSKRPEPAALTAARAAKRGSAGGASGGPQTAGRGKPRQAAQLKSRVDFEPATSNPRSGE